jgi:hypothetical protein
MLQPNVLYVLGAIGGEESANLVSTINCMIESPQTVIQTVRFKDACEW